LDLEATPDILAEIARAKSGQRVVGFSAGTADYLESARRKLQEKELDLVVANRVDEPDAGFGSPTNRVVLLGADGSQEALPLLTKREVAARLLDRLESLGHAARLPPLQAQSFWRSCGSESCSSRSPESWRCLGRSRSGPAARLPPRTVFPLRALPSESSIRKVLSPSCRLKLGIAPAAGCAKSGLVWSSARGMPGRESCSSVKGLDTRKIGRGCLSWERRDSS